MVEKARSTKSPSTLEKLVPILLIMSVVLAFAVGVLWQKVNSLEQNGTKALGNSNSANVADTQPQPQAPANGKLTDAQAKTVPEINSTDKLRGNKNAKVVVIEYSDLECPFCKRFQDTMNQVMKNYGDKVAWVYRHFPLDTLHPKARTEAEAAECAFEQGGNEAFWKFIDKVYATTPSNNGLDLATLPQLASQVGLNGTKLQSCIDAGTHKDFINQQETGGTQAGVTGTPGNFVVVRGGSTWGVPGAVPFETLKTTIDEALAEAK